MKIETPITSATNKKKFQKHRMMDYFIDATYRIIQKEGLEGISIRKISDLAGYNSATIYNYFDNLDHLLFMASMHYLEDYNSALAKNVRNCTDALDIYMTVSYYFCIYSFAEPHIYYSLFFTYLGDKFAEYTAQYYEIYLPPDHDKAHKTIKKIVKSNDLYKRSLAMLMDCVREELLEANAAKDFNEVCILLYQGVLNNVQLGFIDKTSALKQIMKLYHQVLYAYINPDKTDYIKASEKKINQLMLKQ